MPGGATGSSGILIGCFDQRRPPDLSSLLNIAWIAESASTRLASRERGLRALRDQPPFLVGEGGVEVEHAGDEGDIAGRGSSLWVRRDLGRVRHHRAAWRVDPPRADRARQCGALFAI